MKLFNHILKSNSKKVTLKKTGNNIGKMKLQPSFSKEWNNTAYFFNQNLLKNIPNNQLNLNNLIKSYFNLYFNDEEKISLKNKFKVLGKKRRTFAKFFISDALIKQNNHKAKITLFIVNREKEITKNKYHLLNKIFFNRFLNINNLLKEYKKNMLNIYSFIKNYKSKYKYIFLTSKINKRKFISYSFEHLSKSLLINQFLLKRAINQIILKYSKKHLKILRRYELKHSLNQSKLNQSILLPKLSNILNNLMGKKLEYNIVNLKSFTFNPDIFTQMLGILIRKRKNLSLAKDMSKILKKASISKNQEKISLNNRLDYILNKYNDSKLISNINIKDLDKSLNFDQVLDNFNQLNKNEKQIHSQIFNSIKYKKLAGIRIEVKGRLTKRYRADRAIYRFRTNGGLKNLYSLYHGSGSVLFRGNQNANLSYSSYKSKRRIGAFAVKGWISGK